EPILFEREGAPSPQSRPGTPDLPDYSDLSDSEDGFMLVPCSSRESRAALGTWHDDYDRPKFDGNFSFERQSLPPPDLPSRDIAEMRPCTACEQGCEGTRMSSF